MPRRARLAVGGIPWHIIQRGNNRSACFYCAEDYQKYLDTLFEQAERYACAVHAYVLMTNHTHLLLTPQSADGPGLLMKHLGQRYVQYINRTYRRSGTLWEGRYKSTLVGTRSYILACYRYIEMNPVRAGMVMHPGEYPWSSYAVNAQGWNDTRIKPHDDYLALSELQSTRQEVYRDMFGTEMDQNLINEIRCSTQGNYALGNDAFRTEIESQLNRRARPGKSGRPKLFVG